MTRLQGRLRRLRTDWRQSLVRFSAWTAFMRNRRAYRFLSEDELRATRRTDTVFIFGSGSSLNDIPRDEWQRMSEADTLGFNWFVHQRFIRCDYHLVREIGLNDVDAASWRRDLETYFRLVADNPHFARTIFLIQTGFRATNGNRALGLGYVPANARVFLWRSRRDRQDPTASLRDGLTHLHGTLQECINFAYLMGWRRIVLVGVDLYNRQYFWMPPGAPLPGDGSTEEIHRTVAAGLIDSLARWRQQFQRDGVELFVHNRRSLLAGVLPVWPRDGATAA